MNDDTRTAWKTLCPSCGQENFVLRLRCESCGAFVRERVPALDLFSTLWGMIEAPTETALRIGRSEQKNYTHLLFALTGPILLALALFAARIGDTTIPFGIVMLGIVVGGPLLGLLVLPLTALWQDVLLRLFLGIRAGYRMNAAWLAWSVTPMMWASVLLLPLLLGIFGLLLFSTNPAPWELLPVPFWSLAALSALTLPWSMCLLPLGIRIHGVALPRLWMLLLAVWLLPAAAVTLGALLIVRLA